MGTAVTVWPMPVRALVMSQRWTTTPTARQGPGSAAWEARIAWLEQKARLIVAARLGAIALGMLAATAAGAMIGTLR